MSKLLRFLFLFSLVYQVNAQVYVIDEGLVYCYDKVIEGADADTFDFFPEKKEYTKDKNHIYFKGKKTTYDRSSFKIHESKGSFPEYFTDKNDVYLYQKNIGFVAIDSNSPQSFSFITKEISKDDSSIYFQGKVVSESDANSFEILNSDYYRDKNYIYYGNNRLPIDTKKMVLIKNKDQIEFIVDKNIVIGDRYHCFQMDGKSFEFINSSYSKDASKVLVGKRIYLKADAKTFEVPNPEINFYGRDKSHQFYYDSTFPIKVEEEYLKSDKKFKEFYNFVNERIIEAFSNDRISKYKKETKSTLKEIYKFPNSNNTLIERGKYIYINGSHQSFIDVNSFEIFNNDYAKDKNHVYLIYEHPKFVRFHEIKDADPSTFSIIENEHDAFCKDAKNVYHHLDKVIGADPATFNVVSKLHSEDKNSVFISSKKLKNLKSTPGKSLQQINKNYFKYGNIVFYKSNFKEDFQIVKNSNLKAFKVVNHFFALNNNDIIYKGEKIGTLERDETITKINEDIITTSKERVFNLQNDVENPIDLSYKKIKGTDYFTDNNKVYTKEGKEILGVNMSEIHSFRTYKKYLILKNNKVLYKDKVIKVDNKTFEIIYYGYYSYYTKDQKNVYYKGKKTALDSKTFYKFNNNFSSDKNGVYYNNKVILGADTKTFHTFYNYGFDANNFYYQNKVVPRSEINFEK